MDGPNKELQLELLMEKIRSKANQFKSFPEDAKALRMAVLDKRYQLDVTDKLQLQKCLDTLQHSIKVTSLQAIVERLESISRQLGLRFQAAGPTAKDYFISSDMFYLEISIETSGLVREVKIQHEGKAERQSCPELVECLETGDFSDFTSHLEGLVSIYQLNADKKNKSKAFVSLQALENDLSTLAQMQSFINEPYNLVHKSPVGILQLRKGGHPMKLTYFIPPYDLLDAETKSSMELSVENVIKRNVGCSVQVCIEGSVSHKMQITSLLTVNRGADGKSSPSFSPWTVTNSTTLPACFTLRLNEPIPLCVPLVNKLNQATSIECADLSTPQPLLSLIVQHASAGQLDCTNNRGLFVTLPDQQHCYFMTDNPSLQGVMVSSIPFTHPTHVPQVLNTLRQQVLFNVLIASCIRPASKPDLEKAIMFEVTTLSWQHMSISFEHPLEGSMATAEFNLSDIANVKCKLFTSANDILPGMEDYANKVVQRCLSIPVTMRALIRRWQQQAASSSLPNPDLPISIGRMPSTPSDTNTNNKFLPELDQKFLTKMEPPTAPCTPPVGTVVSETVPTPPPADILSFLGTSPSGAIVTPPPLPPPGFNPFDVRRKRKAASDSGKGRSPKRLMTDDSDGGSAESTPLGTPLSDHDEVASVKTEVEWNFDAPASEPTFPIKSDPLQGEDEGDGWSEAKGDQMKRKKKLKMEGRSKSMDLSMLNDDPVVPSVSITPVTGSMSMLSSMGLEGRRGIEIIPITTAASGGLPSSITITPISGGKGSEKVKKEGKDDERRKREKKRKHGAMQITLPAQTSMKGIKESISSISVTLNAKKCGTPPHSSPSKPATSPTTVKKSPKHPSSGGKPSMSTLKSAAVTLTSSTTTKMTTGEKFPRPRDRSRTSSPTIQGKGKTPLKLKGLDLGLDLLGSKFLPVPVTASGEASPTTLLQTTAQQNKANLFSLSMAKDQQFKNIKAQKKNSINDVIEGLLGKLQKSERKPDSLQASVSSSSPKSGDNAAKTAAKPGGSEYQVKSSSEGIKLTINKKNKDGLGKMSSSMKSSTGLKPGVNSGPASRKTLHKGPSKSPLNISMNSGMLGMRQSPSPSKGMLGANSKAFKPISGMPKHGSSDPKRDKYKTDKLKGLKSNDPSRIRGLTKKVDMDNTEHTLRLFLEGLPFDGRKLDPKFQIPKLSRLDPSKSSIPESTAPKEKCEKDPVEPAKSEPMKSIQSPLLPTPLMFPPEEPTPLAPPPPPASSSSTEPTPREEGPTDLSMKPPAKVDEPELLPPPPPPPTTTWAKPTSPNSPQELVIDYPPSESSKKPRPFPPSPSVSLHIVKSPAPLKSPLAVPSPHSSQASPCVIDDELMDEALIGLGK